MTSNNPYDQIVLFGDSITQMSFAPELSGLASRLADAYIRKLDVINRGFSGYNTEWALPILKQLLPTTKDQENQKTSIPLMTIFFGANDSALPGFFQHVPIEKYVANIKEMVHMVKDPKSEFYNPNMRLILITPPPLYEPLWEKRCKGLEEPLNRTNENARKYGEAVKQIGQESNIPVVDLWSNITNASEDSSEDLSNFFSDGLHLNSKGYLILYNSLMKCIADNFPDIHPDALEPQIPYWRQIKKENSASQFVFPLLK